jgi:hypothetical protein
LTRFRMFAQICFFFFFFPLSKLLFSRFILHNFFNWRLGFFFFSLLFVEFLVGLENDPVISGFLFYRSSWVFLVNSLNLYFFPDPFFQYFKWFSKIIYTVTIIFPFHSPLFFFSFKLSSYSFDCYFLFEIKILNYFYLFVFSRIFH